MSHTVETAREPVGRGLNRRRFLRNALAGLTALSGAGIAEGYRERWQLQVVRHAVALPNLPPPCLGLTIAQMTDFHCSPWIPKGYVARAVALCNSLKPALILLTGDFVSVPSRTARLYTDALARLEAKLGVFAVLGNHDHWVNARAVTDDLIGIGIRVLTNRSHALEPGLWLAGIDDTLAGSADFGSAVAGVPADAPVVLLSHNPRGLDLAQSHRCLVLTGHTHGGQIAVPGLPRLVPRDVWGTGYVEGWYQKGAARMYISRGVGMVRPALRFNCLPEITLLTLSATSS